MTTPPALQAAVAELERLHPPGEVMTDPMALIVWENVGYLVDDERRAELFEAFTARIGLDPTAIAEAPQALLLELAARGGMRPDWRARRLRSIGELALAHAGGDLAAALRALPSAKARALLKRFPGIGDPGADRIMLFCGVEARPALESNGLRVLVRLGYVPAQADYARSYRAAVEVLRAQGRPDRDWLVIAFQVLRSHGQALCKRAGPQRQACPLGVACTHEVPGV
jgi:endonuclease-3